MSVEFKKIFGDQFIQEYVYEIPLDLKDPSLSKTILASETFFETNKFLKGRLSAKVYLYFMESSDPEIGNNWYSKTLQRRTEEELRKLTRFSLLVPPFNENFLDLYSFSPLFEKYKIENGTLVGLEIFPYS